LKVITQLSRNVYHEIKVFYHRTKLQSVKWRIYSTRVASFGKKLKSYGTS